MLTINKNGNEDIKTRTSTKGQSWRGQLRMSTEGPAKAGSSNLGQWLK